MSCLGHVHTTRRRVPSASCSSCTKHPCMARRWCPRCLVRRRQGLGSKTISPARGPLCTGWSSRVDDADPTVGVLGSRFRRAQDGCCGPKIHPISPPGQWQQRRRWQPTPLVAEAARQLEQQWWPAPLFAAWAQRQHPSPPVPVTETSFR